VIGHSYVAPSHARWLDEAPERIWRRESATLVFADVSGFTAMSERLARRGKIGAEETTAAINLLFAALLDATSAGGGEILKFGGDAVLAMFTGPDHPARGAGTAQEMQRAMRAIGRIETAAGVVRLRLSAGVASGEAHLFCVGSAPRDLLVAGPLATAVVECEAAAEPGEVVVSHDTARLLDDHVLGEPKGPGRLLRSRGASLIIDTADLSLYADRPAELTLRPPTVPAGFDARPALPDHLHDREPTDGEHRFASVAFVKFRGVDALIGDVDHVATLLQSVVVTASAACARHGVTLVATDVDAGGGKLFLAAGAPTASPDDEDRLLHALRDILALSSPLQLRAGAHRGRAFVGDIGTDQRRFWSVMGDVVNLTARVMSKAQPGQLLATTALLERLRDDFERTPVPPFRVKGKTEPVFAEAVGVARAARRSTSGRMSALVGREQELETLRTALAEVRAGANRVVELVGEPGIGKSRLVEATLAEAEGLRWARVAGGPYSAHSPYLALRLPLRHLLAISADAGDAEIEAALRARLAEADPRLVEWLPLIAIPFGLDLEPTETTASLASEFARDRLHGLLGALVGILLGDAPGMLVIEDTHWLDEASARFLQHLARQRRPWAGNLVLATRRAGSPSLFEEQDPTTIELQPLDLAAASAMLAGGEGDVPLPPGAADRLIERSGGNPLLLQALLIAARSGLPIDELPDSVEALVMSYIDALPAADRLFVRQAAVLGIQVSPDLLGALLGLEPVAVTATLDRLGDFFVADATGVVRFRHALLRAGAYEALSYRRRRELHARAAELIEARAGADVEAQAELLAIHFHAAGDWEQTWRYARLAADLAFARAAPVEAIGFITRALDAARTLDRLPPSEIAHAVERQGDAAQLAGQPEAAIRSWRQARRHLRDDPVACAALLFKEGRQLETSRGVSQSLATYTRGLNALKAAPRTDEAARLRARLVLGHGAARYRGGRLREALPYLEAAIGLAEASSARDVLAHAYYVTESVHEELGTGEAERYRGLALPIFEELGDAGGVANVLINDGATAYSDGRWGDAVELYERAAAVYHTIGDVNAAASTLANIAELRIDQNRLDEAETLLREALATFRAAGYRLGVGFVLSNLGRAAMRRGDTDEAFALLAQAREQLHAMGVGSLVLEVDGREAAALLRTGDASGALELAGQIRTRAHALGAPPTLLCALQRLAGVAKLRLGDPEGARVRFEEALEIARSVGALYEEGLCLIALGRLGDAAVTAQGRAILDDLGVVEEVVRPS
jgi:class 3 adenylate cyclase/tetratricopeptide (TPR) repeat protein